MLGLGSSVAKPLSVQYTTPAPDGWQEFVDGTKSVFARYGRAIQTMFANTDAADGTRSAFTSIIPLNNTGCWVQDGQVVLNEHNYTVQALVSAGELDPDQTWSVQDFYNTAYASVDTSTEIGSAWFNETYLDSSYPVFSIDQMESFGVHLSMLLFVLGYTYGGSYSFYAQYTAFDLSTQIANATTNPDFFGQFDWIENIPATAVPTYGETIYPNSPCYLNANGTLGVYIALVPNFITSNLPFFDAGISYQRGLNFSIYNVCLPGGAYYNNWGCNNPIINSLATYGNNAFYKNPDTVYGGYATIMQSYLDRDTYWGNPSWWNSVVAWANENPHITGLYDPSANTIVNILDVFYSDEADNYGFDGFAPPL